MSAYIQFEDKFEVICKTCGSKNVSLSVDECEECGNTISGYCNQCRTKFNYHDFEKTKQGEK
jgi:predicted RNA-binding Zn-ribbon protein involved in translation (DUF1610 family)